MSELKTDPAVEEAMEAKVGKSQPLKLETPIEDVQNIVDFDGCDPENPNNWPYWRKLTIQLLVASMFMLG